MRSSMTNERPQIDDGLLFDLQVFAAQPGAKWELYVPGISTPLFSGWAGDDGDLHGALHKAVAGVREWYEAAVRSTPGGRPHAPGRNAR